jgi:prepilin-type N-terminal cleavage/methylation domain-containing protein
MSARRRSRQGFTLIEVLVGVTVAGLALTAGFATLAFLSDSDQPVDRAAALALTGATTRSLLYNWLSEARLSGRGRNGQNFQGFDSEDQGTPSDELIFPTTASTPLGVSTSVVRLFVDNDPDTPEQGLVAELTERITDEPRTVELIRSVGALDVRYLMEIDGTTGEWVESWLTGRSLPQAIELTFQPSATDSLPLLLRLRLLVPVEAAR